MKHLIFVLLKIIEISLIPISCFIFYYLGIFYCYIITYLLYGNFDISYQIEKGSFIIGLVGVSISLILFTIITFIIKAAPYIFIGWINKNKKWSEKTYNWLKSKKKNKQ